jgi:iron complex transport system substrate-binding protein
MGERSNARQRSRPGAPVWALACALLACAAAAGEPGNGTRLAPLEGGARRIVSLDLCTDQLLIELAERSAIAAVTHLAADPAVSAIPQKARGLASTRGGAEEVLGYDPDLILAGPFGVSPTVALLRRLGRNVVVVPLAQDLDGVRRAVRVVAEAIGEEARGRAMIAKFDARLAGISHSLRAPPTAVVYQIGGAVSGPGSLADAALTAAGFFNLASDYRTMKGGQVPLESLLAMPPELLVLASNGRDYATPLADNLRHPALLALAGLRPTLALSWRYWLCGTPHIAEAIERLARMRERIEAAAQ